MYSNATKCILMQHKQPNTVQNRKQQNKDGHLEKRQLEPVK